MVPSVLIATETKLPVSDVGNKVNVLAPVFEKVTELPKQTVFVLTLVNKLGSATTLTVSKIVLKQPKGLVPVIENTVVAAGLVVKEGNDILPGLEIKLAAPLKLTVAVFPAQIIWFAGVTVKEGKGFTPIVIDEVLIQPFKS